MNRRVCAFLLGVVAAGSALLGGWQAPASAAAEKTGVGLSDHVMMAYREGWKYSYGSYGQFSGGTRVTDCAGLIKSYLWWTDAEHNPKAGSIAVGGGASAMLNSASESGTIDYSDYSSLPRTHGLLLYQPGHVGVYVGNDMAVDNRDYGYDIKYEPVFNRARKKWTTWFKLPQITYPESGFYEFDGKTYYYEGGEYVIKDSRTIGDVVYTFAADGTLAAQSPTPEALAAQAAAKAAEEERLRAEAEAQAKLEQEIAAEQAALDAKFQGDDRVVTIFRPEIAALSTEGLGAAQLDAGQIASAVLQLGCPVQETAG